MFTITGYFAHDVHKTVPFRFIDSVEAIDAERIARLRFKGYSENFVVVLLTEDASALKRGISVSLTSKSASPYFGNASTKLPQL